MKDLFPVRVKGEAPLSGTRQEDPYRVSFENNPLPMWVFDTVSLRFLMVNKSAVHLYGYTKGEFLQMTIKDIRPEEDVPTLEQFIASAREDLSFAGEWKHRRKNGEIIYVEVSSHILPAQNGTHGRLAVMNDITNRKLAEQKLKETQQLLETILHNVVEIIFSLNEQMELTYVSHQCLEMLGFTPEDFYKDQWLWFKLVHPDDRHLFENFLPYLKRSQKKFAAELRMRTASGEEKWIAISCRATLDAEGRMTRVDGSASDISSRRKTEERLRFADFTIERSEEAFLWTSQSGHITRVNQALCRLLKYEKGEVLQLSIFDIAPVYQQETWQEHWQELEHVHSMVFETEFKGKDAKLHPVEIKLNLFRFEGENYSFICVRENAERKRAEAEKAKLTEETVRQNEHLQQFAYIVSHNLRAPVANIMGLIKLYNRKDPLDAINPVIINKLDRTGQRLDSVINDLNEILTIRGQGAEQVLEKIDLQQLLGEVLESLSSQLTACQAQVITDFAAGHHILGIRSYVHSIFFNLILNAIKFRSPQRNLLIQVRAVFLHDFLCLSFEDNGLGINLQKEKQKVFGLYRRFHSHIEGKGLGLFLVRNQIETLGGRIEIESEPNKGSTFKVYFQVY